MNLKKKYAELILKGLQLENKEYLFIDVPSFLSEFTDIIVSEAKKYNLNEVYVNEYDVFKKHDLLMYLDQENINKHPMFDNSIFNKYAKLDAAFLFIDSMVPNLMEDVPVLKLTETKKHIRDTEKYFRDLYETDKLTWCIAGAANIYWARDGLNMSEDDLRNLIYKVCLVDDTNNPYEDWCKKFASMQKRCDYLNDLQLDYLHYKSSNGTDLLVYLPQNHIWASGRGIHGEICNLPTEEIFTSPQFNKTEGIVYSSKPLYYNNILIEDFYIKFKDGKVVDYDAKVGRDVLKSIIEFDDYSCYLGECALVSYDSPISNTKVIFKSTLYDENASCHLALGTGFNECVKNSDSLMNDDLRNLGVNFSNIHVDFMVGTNDLNIVGVTHDNKEITIMQNGNIVI